MAEYEQTCQLLNEMGLTVASQVLDAQLSDAAKSKDLTYLSFSAPASYDRSQCKEARRAKSAL